MAPNAQWTMPATQPGTNRTLYFFLGSKVQIADQSLTRHSAVELPAEQVPIQNGPDESQFLLLQGRPIGEPVAQYGPFVMNTRDEIHQAFRDYQLTGFGGGARASDEPVMRK